MSNNKLNEELSSFNDIWQGGYFEGDPLDPFAASTYGALGFMSILHATYLRCIKPYVNAQTVALEIGPGRGAWTKALLPAKEVYTLDALSAEHNGFFEYLGHPSNVKYFQVEDFECKVLPNDYFDYMFSFGCLCHVSFDGIEQYATNLKSKLRSGANCFWMIADYAKYNKAVSAQNRVHAEKLLVPPGRRYTLQRYLVQRMYTKPIQLKDTDEESDPSNMRWHDAGIERTCAMLENLGYRVADPDVETCLRDPIIHFIKP